jgi:hypothetical protein
MTLPEHFRDLLDEQEALEAHRTKVLLQLQSSNLAAEIVWDRMLSLQVILAQQVKVSKLLLAECVTLTCENVEWPVEIRA